MSRSGLQRPVDDDVYSEDYDGSQAEDDDDDEDDEEEEEEEDVTYLPRQVAGGHLPPSVFTALQQLHVANATQQFQLQQRNVVNAMAEEEEAELLLAAALSAQQQFQSSIAQRQFQHPPSSYANEAHLNRTPPNNNAGREDAHYHYAIGLVNQQPSSDGTAASNEYADDDDDEDGGDEEEEDDVTADRNVTAAPPQGGGDGEFQDGDANQLVDMSAEDYEPTEHEILEYCEWLGMDAQSDRCLTWIAREALKAPLPENWKMCTTEDREIYYFNVRTGESIWDHPMDAFYKSLYKEEKAKLDKKRKRMRMFTGCLPVKPLAEFFSDLSDTCGVGAVILDDPPPPPPASSATALVTQQPAPWVEVPEALVDPIDFRVFVDPVVLPTSGRTVSRHTIINNNWRDPFTREYCENRRLVVNVDKRMEVDRWLLQMMQAYVQRMVGGHSSGVQRLVTMLPFLLDRDEEASVRAQGLVLSWLMKQVVADKDYAEAMSLYEQRKVENERKQQQASANVPPMISGSCNNSNRSSPSTTPREQHNNTNNNSRITKRTHTHMSSSVASGRPSVARSSDVPIKKLQAALQQGRCNSQHSGRGTNSVVVADTPHPSSVIAGDTPTPTTDVLVPQPPPPREVLSELLQHMPSEHLQTLLLSLLTMSTSVSREALLLLAEQAPFVLKHSAFRGFSEEMLQVLRVAKRDLWDIAVGVHQVEGKELQRQAAQNGGSDSGVGSPRPDDRSVASSNVLSSPVSRTSRGSRASTTEGGGGATEDLPTTPPPPPLVETTDVLNESLDDLLVYHVVKDSERVLTLRWVECLSIACQSQPDVCSEHPVQQLDLSSAIHVVLCCVASLTSVAANRKPSPQGSGVAPNAVTSASASSLPPAQQRTISSLVQVLMKVDGWPSKLSAISERHLRSLMELAVLCDDKASLQVQALFDLTLHGSERCLDVIRRNSLKVKRNILALLAEESKTEEEDAAGMKRRRHLLSSAAMLQSLDATDVHAQEMTMDMSCANLMAAVMVFHELCSLEEFVAVSSPTVALKIGYNLTPRLARSQWRPKHFHNTVSTLVELVERFPREAWLVMDRVGLTFFLHELMKKKSNTAEVRNKIETLEYSDKQLEHSITMARWRLLSLSQLRRNQLSIEAVILERRQQRLKKNLPVPTESLLLRRSRQRMFRMDGTDASPGAGTEASLVSQGDGADDSNNVNNNFLFDNQLAHAEHKVMELTRQRASLLSQALMLLITVRLKPKQHRSSQMSTTTGGLESPMTISKGKGTSVAHISSVVQSPSDSSRGGGGGGGRNSGGGNATPRVMDLRFAPPPPPAAPVILPTLRAPRGGGGQPTAASGVDVGIASPSAQHIHPHSGIGNATGSGFLPPI